MKEFSLLFTELDQSNKTNEKLAALARFFDHAPEADQAWGVALLSGKRPKRPVNTTLLRLWAAESAGIPLWLFEESYEIVGDLAETISLLVPAHQYAAEKSLDAWMRELMKLGTLEEEEKKKYILEAWKKLDKASLFVFNKLITGGFRVGVSQSLVVRALSAYLQIEPNRVAHALMGDWSPVYKTLPQLLENKDDEVSKPYPFFLAYALDNGPEELGEPTDWCAERKWDGIRGQIIVRRGEIFIWSRGEELITDKFPELLIYRSFLPNGTVLDGEIMPYREKPLPFQVLQTRIGRKNVSRKQLEEAPVVFMAYDVLEWQGIDIRNEPYSDRRSILEELASHVPPMKVSPRVEFRSWEELARERDRSGEYNSEGIMIKRMQSPYRVGRKRGDWWKWKVDPMSIDAVLIYAQRGHGRRANLYTDYTFAVWNGEGVLVPFAKAYSGLTDEEIRRVDSWIKRNTVEKFGPVRSVRPELVFEIAFEGINLSTRHKSGIALRFPRITRWRSDKKPEEADTLDNLRKFLPG